ncbi:Acyl transferase/acyl hydrolase/lysophospholipase protein [Dioscorea alata]|uniref:Acyl transferase/acyl hydrolase/lysophospholipase protein n=1 Tax=Dioscorea alata TaxID=55571 RepID=A0ACB7V1M9_DIOAL|nr:Acyl transferase/acyl hydrolase/lysophospholipase protein [Dioscorea alata]
MDFTKLSLQIFSQLELNWLKNHHKARILTIDGGGLLAGQALLHLESQIQSKTSNPDARIPDLFDLIAGTGMGGVLAALLTVSNPNSTRPLFSAKEALDFLHSNHHRLFRPSGLLRRRFSSRSFDRVLRRALPGLTLRNACKPLLIPCYDLNTSAPFVFSRADASESLSFDFELWRVCRATAATPGLFKPCELVSVDGTTSCAAIDGGVVMNNPAAAAVTHVLHNKREFPFVAGVEDLVVLSIGNGLPAPPPRGYRRCSGAGVIGIVLDGVSGTVDQMLGNAFRWNPSDYVRIQANGPLTEKDDVKMAGERMLNERGLETLPFGGKRLLTETNGQRIEAFVQRLVTSTGDNMGLASSPSPKR